MKKAAIMKRLLAVLVTWSLFLFADAEVTVVFDFANGPESGITMPSDIKWPTVNNKSVTINDGTTFRMGDISIRTKYTNATKSRIHKNPEGESWHYRLFDGSNLSFMCDDDNIISVHVSLSNRDDQVSDPSKTKIVNGGGNLLYSEDNKSIDWSGNNPAVTLTAGGKLYVTKIEVTTDKQASLSDTVVSDNAEYSAVYFNLQGQRVDNPSGGLFIRIVNGKSEKTYLP